ncbi:MerR family transcriptional regulator [Corynebacterium sp. ES2794-CONJ1]|uniref:transcriptional regulator FtsR n=1 Tax=unclassified Corynebacterium TaxID=2624378 RepID=UPI00216785F8|nr:MULTISPECIES: MerR family transcriptional regulator [unclassified Corynebacterium]MCS4489378.1 MerR family transcriptional regulator [Corynebacterium sp. ES2775-CONJ]MCS4491191.1 MerR family transcriptional regulator [Corynebacterium sp. ES2715-CONJ3]MCS4530928.1 MerR family transcriptional regulator [Corynebacterium sp. ES2730-CONJ]MCU9518295.1 MerR family transcriptional regulator [Corynebacterium sp. ES2794-CONJ1]
MSALPQPHAESAPVKRQKTMSIGVVLRQLTTDFPDVTVSKIRFLESEGLISPQRTASGYRRFVQADLDRLRLILTLQRDRYMPLRVIREELDNGNAHNLAVISSVRQAQPMIGPDEFRAPIITRLSAEDVAEQAGVKPDFVLELDRAHVIKADTSGFFTADDVRLVSTAAGLAEFGFEVRHLKALTNGAARQAALLAQVIEPVAKSKSDSAKERAEEMSSQLTALMASLHAGLLKNAVREQSAL